MATTTRALLPYPALTDDADIPSDIHALAAEIDAKIAIWMTGTTAARPAAATAGRIYRETDGDRVSLDTGAAWRKLLYQIASGDYKADAPVDATAFKVAGTLLASTHLTDTAALARLASPALTGTPSAPTASGGTNTTQIATTAFVTAAIAAINLTPGAGTITSAMIQDGAITNIDVNGAAAIAQSKIALAVTNAEVSATAAIAYSKLNLAGAVKVSDLNFDPATQAELDAINTALDARLDVFDALFPGGRAHSMQLHMFTPPQSIPSGGDVTEIVFDGANPGWTLGGMISAGGIGGIQVPQSKVYNASVAIDWAPNATGERYCEIRRYMDNGTLLSSEPLRWFPSPTGGGAEIFSTTPMAANATDHFRLFVYQNSGAPLNCVKANLIVTMAA